MKLSSKARYGLKAVCELAKNYGQTMPLSQIALNTELSEGYLEQLFLALRKAEIIGSVRGVSGGYFLIKAPQNISVGEVLRVLEDGLQIVDCIHGNCNAKCHCSTHDVWNKLYLQINNFLDSITIQSIIDEG
ncbi:MAG: Rrf2 family transcriptional regulator [Clostridia bacterium]